MLANGISFDNIVCKKNKYRMNKNEKYILVVDDNKDYLGLISDVLNSEGYNVIQKENGWFGEGDDRFYIDGESIPSIQGTGTEDYFNDSWGFREFTGIFHGVPLYEGPLAGDRVSAYRWHIPDPIRFKKSLKFYTTSLTKKIYN